MSLDAAQEFLIRNQYAPADVLVARMLPDGRVAWPIRKMFTYAIAVGAVGGCGPDEHWCFASRPLALAALEAWDMTKETEPTGWLRHPRTGRRRPDGDASKEYVAP